MAVPGRGHGLSAPLPRPACRQPAYQAAVPGISSCIVIGVRRRDRPGWPCFRAAGPVADLRRARRVAPGAAV